MSTYTAPHLRTNLQQTPIHHCILRAFPHTDFPKRVLEVLARFRSGDFIKGEDLEIEEREMMQDLVTAGIIEVHRYPKFFHGMFAGFTVLYRYNSNLNYEDPVIQDLSGEYRRQRDLAWAISVCAFIALLGSWGIIIFYK